MVFCNIVYGGVKYLLGNVTILILIDGFLQFKQKKDKEDRKSCHNPYFNRWFSAILIQNHYLKQFFSHNPYFNRWFSAIGTQKGSIWSEWNVTILILIDGFLQSNGNIWEIK